MAGLLRNLYPLYPLYPLKTKHRPTEGARANNFNCMGRARRELQISGYSGYNLLKRYRLYVWRCTHYEKLVGTTVGTVGTPC